MGFVIQVFRGGLRIVEPELDGRGVDLPEPFHKGNQLILGILLVQDAVDPEPDRQPGQESVIGFLHIVLHVPADIEAGDFPGILLQEGQHFLFALFPAYRQGGVDVHFMGIGHLVQHHLETFQVGQGLPSGKDKVAVRSQGIHFPDAFTDGLQGKSRHIGILFFIHTERAVVPAVIRHKNSDRGPAVAGLVRVSGCFHCGFFSLDHGQSPRTSFAALPGAAR